MTLIEFKKQILLSNNKRKGVTLEVAGETLAIGDDKGFAHLLYNLSQEDKDYLIAELSNQGFSIWEFEVDTDSKDITIDNPHSYDLYHEKFDGSDYKDLDAFWDYLREKFYVLSQEYDEKEECWYISALERTK